MIVVIGSPVVRIDPGTRAATVRGLAGRVALAAAAADRRVQVVGRIGDDGAGDDLLLALASGGVGHAAVLRDAAHATPVDPGPALSGEDPLASEPAEDLSPAGLPLDPADVQLALRYLTDFSVMVLAGPLDQAAIAAAFDAAEFAAAHVIRLEGPGPSGAAGPSDVPVTEFEPPSDDEPAFAEMVGQYAAGLDAGQTPADAFEAATRGTHWERASEA